MTDKNVYQAINYILEKYIPYIPNDPTLGECIDELMELFLEELNDRETKNN